MLQIARAGHKDIGGTIAHHHYRRVWVHCNTFRNLYSFGSGADGKLGHGNTSDVSEPKIIDYFQKNNIKVKDAVAGERHTIVLSDKGEVYTFGYGRKDVNLLMRLFVNPVGPTGHGKNVPKIISKPTKVKAL